MKNDYSENLDEAAREELAKRLEDARECRSEGDVIFDREAGKEVRDEAR